MKTAFFDSGIGGLSVLHEARRQMPEEDFIFYADCIHAPYGEKAPADVQRYVDRAVDFLIENGAQAIVLACNTATSVACTALRRRLSVPVIGMEPAAKMALDLDGTRRVLVAATPVTTRGEKLHELMVRVDRQHLVDLLALPQLVRFAEADDFSRETVLPYLRRALAPFDLSAYSSLVLGCTHFNYFKDSFRALLPAGMRLLDGNAGTVRQLKRRLQETGAGGGGTGSTAYYFSGRPAGADELSRISRLMERLDRMRAIE